MPTIKPLDKIGEKWTRVASGAAVEYTEGVKNPRKDWKAETLKAASNYDSGVQRAIQNKSFEKGVNKSGTDEWQRGALEKGSARYGQGVSLAKDKYVRNFAPFHDVIANTTLPARGPKGDPKNIERVRVLADALHKRKLSG